MPRHVDDAPPAPVGGYASLKKQQEGDPTPVSEKSDRALHSMVRYAADPLRAHDAKEELKRREAKREEERQRKAAEEEQQKLFKRLAPAARKQYFKEFGREPTPQQLSKAVDFMIEDGYHKTMADPERLGDAVHDRHLPDDLAVERATERARQQQK